MNLTNVVHPCRVTRSVQPHDRAPARYYSVNVVDFANVVDFVEVVDFVDAVNVVDQAGAGTWGIPAASPQQRGGWSPWQPRRGRPKTGRAARRACTSRVGPNPAREPFGAA